MSSKRPTDKKFSRSTRSTTKASSKSKARRKTLQNLVEYLCCNIRFHLALDNDVNRTVWSLLKDKLSERKLRHRIQKAHTVFSPFLHSWELCALYGIPSFCPDCETFTVHPNACDIHIVAFRKTKRRFCYVPAIYFRVTPTLDPPIPPLPQIQNVSDVSKMLSTLDPIRSFMFLLSSMWEDVVPKLNLPPDALDTYYISNQPHKSVYPFVVDITLQCKQCNAYTVHALFIPAYPTAVGFINHGLQTYLSDVVKISPNDLFFAYVAVYSTKTAAFLWGCLAAIYIPILRVTKGILDNENADENNSENTKKHVDVNGNELYNLCVLKDKHGVVRV